MDFKDRLVTIHQWLNIEFMDSAIFRPGDALPDGKTMAEIVVLLKDHATHDEDPPRRLVFYGFHGAAWLLVYSWKILGLNVCLIHKNGNIHPVQGDYDSASVIIVPHMTSSSEVVHNIGRSAKAIILKGHTRRMETNWLLSCTDNDVNFFDLCCGLQLEDKQAIGDIIFSAATEYIQQRIGKDPPGSADPHAFPHYVLHLDTFITNLREILYLLGLPKKLEYKENWRDGFDFGNQLPLLKARLCRLSSTRQARIKHFLRTCNRTDQEPSENLHCVCVQHRVSHIFRGLTLVSSCLAFTDWAREHRKMPVNIIPSIFTRGIIDDDQGSNEWRMVYDMVTKQASHGSYAPFRLDRPSFTSLFQLLNVILCPSQDSKNANSAPRSHNLIGMDLDGLLFIDNRAVEASLKPGPIFLLREGMFALAGAQRTTVEASRYSVHDRIRTHHVAIEALRPWNALPDITLCVSGSVGKSTIKLQYSLSSVIDGKKSFQTIDISNIFENRFLLWATTPCNHSFALPIPVHEEPNEYGSIYRDEKGAGWWIADINGFDTVPRWDFKFGLYPVANNHLAQWAALSTPPPRIPCLFILQYGACLSCTRDQARAVRGGNTQDAIVILAGNGKLSDMNSSQNI